MDSKQIIRTYYIISSLYTLSASLIWGVNTLFLLDAGLDIFGVFVANAVFTAAMVVFEIPTGVVADTSGRRVSFLLSTLVLALATLGYVGVSMVGGGLFWFCVMSVFLGLGFTFYSGAVEAWLVDALKTVNYADELDHVFARGAMISGGTMLIGTVGGGFLGNADLAIPYIGRALLLMMACGWAFFYMFDIGYKPRAMSAAAIPAEMKKVLQQSIRYGWNSKPVRLIMMVSLVQSLYSMWGFYATQPYFLDLLNKPDAVWVSGVVAALVSITMMIGNGMVDRFMGRVKRRTTIMITAAAVLTIATIGVGLAQSFWVAVPLFLLGTLTRGFFLPLKQSYLHQVIPSDQRATVISFDALFDSLGGMVGQTGLGYLARQRDIASGFVVGGALTILALPFLFLLRNLNHPADEIKQDEDAPSVIVEAMPVGDV